jgi:hypothetical protein
MLPGVEEEAVERAGGGEKKRDRQEIETKLRKARDGRDEDGGGEEDADGEFFGETMSVVAGKRTRVNDEEPCTEQRGQQRVEAHGMRVQTAQQGDEDAGGDCDEDEEGAAVLMMEAVALFEFGWRRTAGERARVEQTVGGVEHPDGDEHRGRCGEGKMEADGGGDGDGPHSGDGGCVE